MSASLEDIHGWLKQAKEKKDCTHLIVALDTFDTDNYPVFVFAHENVAECVEIIKEEDMQSVDEVYDMSMDLKVQLNSEHVWNI